MELLFEMRYFGQQVVSNCFQIWQVPDFPISRENKQLRNIMKIKKLGGHAA